MRFPVLVALTAVLGTAIPLRAAEVVFRSGNARVALIELFTSEGCSSCPPAERWLSALRDDPELWRTFVPVSWHVDYWNRLGWPDRFSRREFTERQYAYVSAWHADSVYTPCFARNGAEWRPGSAVSVTASAGVLTLHYDGQIVRAQYPPAGRGGAESLRVHVVLLGAGISVRVTAGENHGAMLDHDFVALTEVEGRLGEELRLPRSAPPGVRRLALAAWVTQGREMTPLQAAGGWLE